MSKTLKLAQQMVKTLKKINKDNLDIIMSVSKKFGNQLTADELEIISKLILK